MRRSGGHPQISGSLGFRITSLASPRSDSGQLQRLPLVPGRLLGLALAPDRSYMQEEACAVALSPLNASGLALSNGLTRLQTRFLRQPSVSPPSAHRQPTNARRR